MDGEYHSLVGGSEENLNYFLYEKYGLDNSEPLLVIPAKLGFLWKYRLVFADPKSPIVVYDDSTRYVMTLSEDIEWLYRVSYSPNCPSLLLISGQKKNGEIFSIAHNTGMDKCFELITDGVPAYKAAIFEDKIFYATKLPNEDFEDRRIVQATTVEWKEVPNDLYITDIIMGENKDYHNEEFEL